MGGVGDVGSCRWRYWEILAVESEASDAAVGEIGESNWKNVSSTKLERLKSKVAGGYTSAVRIGIAPHLLTKRFS